MKKLVMVFLFLLVISFIFVSCASKGGIDIVIIQNDPTVVQDGSILTPNTMAKFAWTDINGHSVKCDFILEKNGEKLEERRGITEFMKVIEEEGRYKATIIPVSYTGARAVKVISFSVNRMYEELYNSNHGLFFKDDFSGFLERVYNETDVDEIGIYYQKQESQLIEGTNGEYIEKVISLTLVDTDDDGMQDALIEAVSYPEGLMLPIEIDVSPYGTAVIKNIVYSESWIKATSVYVVDGYAKGQSFNLATPLLLAKAGLELSVLYNAYMVVYPLGIEKHYLELRERYDADTKPEFTLEEATTLSSQRDANVTVNVKAPHVADYATIYDTHYMQISVSYPASLTLDTVDFGNFVDGLKEFTHYRTIDLSDRNILTLYRGLVKGDDEPEAVTELFAVLNFKAEGNGTGTIYFDQDLSYDFAYGSLFQDSDHKNVEGFIFDDAALELEWSLGS